MSTDRAYTDETVELVAAIVADGEAAWMYVEDARKVLDALAAAGLLVNAGGEVRHDWLLTIADEDYGRVRTRDRTYTGKTAEYMRTEIEAARSLGRAVDRIRKQRVTTWPDGSTLTGPWVEVPDA